MAKGKKKSKKRRKRDIVKMYKEIKTQDSNSKKGSKTGFNNKGEAEIFKEVNKNETLQEKYVFRDLLKTFLFFLISLVIIFAVALFVADYEFINQMRSKVGIEKIDL